MTDSLHHRGPDDTGHWIDEEAGIALGHRRLAIIDLSPLGHQPMHSPNGRWVIVFNGEIYNFERIRSDLAAEGMMFWQGHSDTEVLLGAIQCWGLERALQKTIGMFSFALWDRANRHLFLGRDRAGEKPIYYGWQGDTLLFGSELKALRTHPSFKGDISPDALATFFRFGHVSGSVSIYSSVSKMEPGTFACFKANDREPRVTRYWNAPLPAPNPAFNDDGAALEKLEELLTDAVRLQMHTDVPTGAFLSGGIDSSLIVALMQKHSAHPVKTFSIGFQENLFNEAEHAKAIATHLGTNHHELTVSANDALSVIPLLPRIYDEPFADSSQIPTYLLAKLTRAYVTVSLSGDAGDELFGGYTRYFQAQQFQRLWPMIPGWMRISLARALEHVPGAGWQMLRCAAPSRFAELLTPQRIRKTLSALQCADIFEVYQRMVSLWQKPDELVFRGNAYGTIIDDTDLRETLPDPVDWMMAMDFRSYLPDDILTKVDRATMAVSLEARIPLLDHRIIEFAAGLHRSQQMQRGTGKLLLRKLLYKHVPQALIDRPKQGFAVPIGEWLRGPLREWAEALLDTNILKANALNPAPIRAAWNMHIQTKEDLSAQLWTVLMYQAWRQEGAA